MSSTPNNVCSFCNGEMITPRPVHTYDYSREGFILKYCNNCFICNDIEETTFENNIVITRLSNRFIKKLLKTLCNREFNFSYEKLNILYNKLVDKNVNDPYTLVELIMLETRELNIQMSQDFVIQMVYSPVGANFSIDSFI